MLDEHQLTILKAAINIIIPPDNAPGGWEGGVGDYLLYQFGGDLKEMLPIYQRGLLALDAEAEKMTGKKLVELDPQSQATLMATIEQGQVQTSWPVNPVLFFALLVEHCAEGFYSDPGNHGNRDEAAWKMIGFEVTG